MTRNRPPVSLNTKSRILVGLRRRLPEVTHHGEGCVDGGPRTCHLLLGYAFLEPSKSLARHWILAWCLRRITRGGP